MTAAATAPVSLSSLFWMFFRIASTSFGGFMALISVVQNEVVERRKLLTAPDMLDGISLASILPGPVAVNVCTYVGYRLRGGAGALVCGVAAVLPSLAIFLLLSVAYFRYGQIPAVSKLFMGVLPAVAAIILVAAWNMGRKALTGVSEALIALAACGVLIGIGGFYSTLGIVVGSGVLGWLLYRGREPAAAAKPATPSMPRVHVLPLAIMSAPLSAVAPLLAFEPSLLAKIFFSFASMSLMLFGGAYVFIPLIQEIVVDGHGWVTHREFIDAVAMAQITPGAILVSAAFVGLKVAGLAGALMATLGIFVPAAVVMVLCSRALDRIKRSAVIRAALHGVRPAVVGMIAAAAWSVAAAAPLHWGAAVVFVAALVALMRFKLDVLWIIPSAGLAGLVIF